MARYDYKCTTCGFVREVTHGMNEAPEVTCVFQGDHDSSAQCGGRMQKVVGSHYLGAVYKTNGFYTTDNKHVIKTQGDTY